jgi:hypothetical protein
MKRWGVIGVQVALLLVVRLAHAGGLGIAGDGFLSSFITWLPTVGYAAMLVGIFAWLASSSDYGQGVLSGSVALTTRGMLGGGAIAIVTALGFTQGAVLS